jgi:hypothetical protein
MKNQPEKIQNDCRRTELQSADLRRNRELQNQPRLSDCQPEQHKIKERKHKQHTRDVKTDIFH